MRQHIGVYQAVGCVRSSMLLLWQPDVLTLLCNTALALLGPFPKVSGGLFPSGYFDLTLHLQNLQKNSCRVFILDSEKLRNFAKGKKKSDGHSEVHVKSSLEVGPR